MGKCKTIKLIRALLNEKNLNIPIHIFGCLDPLSVITFFLSGADIFDGLSWLRFGFKNGLAIYLSNYALLNEDWTFQEKRERIKAWIWNISELGRLQNRMRKFCTSFDINEFELEEHYAVQIRKLLQSNDVIF